MANQLIQLFQILARSGIRFWKARPRLLSLLVQILAVDFRNRILLGSPFGSDSAARQRNPSIKAEPNRAKEPQRLPQDFYQRNKDKNMHQPLCIDYPNVTSGIRELSAKTYIK